MNDTTRVLRAVQVLVDKHCYLSTPEDRDAVVLWSAAQWTASSFQTLGRLYFQSSEPGSGKTETMMTVARLSREEINIVNATPAVVYRVLSKFNKPPTLALDEADMIWGQAGSASAKQELLAVANAGYKRSGSVWKPRGTDDVAKFPCYGPMTLAGLGTLPDTLYSRSIVVPMKHAPEHVKLVPYNETKHLPLFEGVRSQLERWSTRVEKDLNTSDPELPTGVKGRLAEVWYGLVAVADLADGDDWSVRARKALVTIGSRKKNQRFKSPTGEFLKVITKGFVTSDRLFLSDVAEQMGPEYTTKQVAKICRDFDVVPRVMKIDGKPGTGVTKSEFDPVLELLGKE